MVITRGLSSSESIPDPVTFVSMLLDPEILAPHLASWKKEYLVFYMYAKRNSERLGFKEEVSTGSTGGLPEDASEAGEQRSKDKQQGGIRESSAPLEVSPGVKLWFSSHGRARINRASEQQDWPIGPASLLGVVHGVGLRHSAQLL